MDTPHKISAQLRKVIIGKDEALAFTLAAIFAGGHILLEDMPGTGKTTLALAVSKTLGLDFKRIQLTPDTVASDITGYCAYDSGAGKFIYHKGAAFANLLLADELNRTSGKTQAALLEVMEEGRVTVDGVTYQLPVPFNVIATQNPSGTVGTSEIPLSQLDRFMVKLSLGMPDKASLKKILEDRSTADPLDSVECVCTAEELKSIRSDCEKVHLSDAVYDYVTALWEAAESEKSFVRGISPRGALSLCRLAKAVAYLDGRDYAVPADIRACFVPVSAHRVILSSQARIELRTPQDILTALLKSVPCPDKP